MEHWKKLLKAARFARKAHEGQKRADGTPYIRHPMGVARMLWDRGHRELDLLRAAYLHDVLEDAKPTRAELLDMYGYFGWDTMTLVSAVTRDNKAETYEEFYRRVKAAGPLAVALKRADREYNNKDLEHAPAECVKLREKAAIKTALMEKVFADG